MQISKIENIQFVFLEENDDLDCFLLGHQFHLGIFHCDQNKDLFVLMSRTKNQILFNANLIQSLSACEQFIILEKGLDIKYLWTSFKGQPRKFKWHEGEMDRMYDILIMQYSKKAENVLAIGCPYEAGYACWKNQRNAICATYSNTEYLTAIESFRQQTVQGKLLF